jgi:hypothetical protein
LVQAIDLVRGQKVELVAVDREVGVLTLQNAQRKYVLASGDFNEASLDALSQETQRAADAGAAIVWMDTR